MDKENKSKSTENETVDLTTKPLLRELMYYFQCAASCLYLRWNAVKLTRLEITVFGRNK